MKILTPAVANIINTLGIEPVNLLEIQWVTNGPFLLYGDKDVPGELNVFGTILELSDLEATVKLDSESQTQTINVTLDDTDGELKDIINRIDIHGKKVILYQWFSGLPLTERLKLFEGEISSPIRWSEGDRTLSFAVISKLADKEVGFSPEEGNFPFLPDNLVGVPWPLVFGKVQNVPAVRLQDVPTTQTAEDLGVKDPTLSKAIIKGRHQVEDLSALFNIYALALLQAEFTADFGDTEEIREQAAALALQIQGYLNQIGAEISRGEGDLAGLREIELDQESNSNGTINILDTTGFPQGVPITVRIGDVELGGVLNGNTFTINSTILTEFDDNFNEPFGFTFVEAGTTITLLSNKTIMYVCNIIDSTVLSVQAFRETEKGQVLVTLPSAWYTIKKVDSGPYKFVFIEFSKPPSSRDESLSDDIYVTLQSSIGPNTIDIMIWLINTYTDLTYDPISFLQVKGQIDNYPSHFMMPGRKNILTTLEEIAFQARCAIWLNNNVFYIKYLSNEVDEVDTITESDIDAGSAVLETTQTEELVTKLTATWKSNLAIDDPNKIVLRYNIKRYGVREREIDFYIYNMSQLVVKSATFWLIRLANVWKRFTFETYPSKIFLEVFDTIRFDFLETYLSDHPIKCLITDVTYQTNDNLLKLSCWVPVRFGEMTPYDFGWPSRVLTDKFFPTNKDLIEDYAGGAGPGADVEGSIALTDEEKALIKMITIQNYIDQGIRDQRRDYGELTPSDLDDRKPEPQFFVRTFGLGEEPKYTYGYDNYGVNLAQPQQPDDGFVGAVFPGKIISVNQASEKLYNVDVYTKSLSDVPLRRIVKQLQLAEFEEIPPDTWCLVAKNNTLKINGVAQTGINGDKFEWTMQNPVWL